MQYQDSWHSEQRGKLIYYFWKLPMGGIMHVHLMSPLIATFYFQMYSYSSRRQRTDHEDLANKSHKTLYSWALLIILSILYHVCFAICPSFCHLCKKRLKPMDFKGMGKKDQTLKIWIMKIQIRFFTQQ
jgi:hypothetical protein